MRIEFVAAEVPTGRDLAVVAPVFENEGLSGAAERIDRLAGGALKRAMTVTGFNGVKGRTLDVVAPTGVDVARILLIGVGGREGFAEAATEGFAVEACRVLRTSGTRTVQLLLDTVSGEIAASAAIGARLATYRFDRYLTRERADQQSAIETVQVVVADLASAAVAGAKQIALGDAVAFARDLVSEPANILFPEEFARRVKAMETLGLTVEILGDTEMAALGMGSLLSVGLGSARESRLAIIEWKGGADPHSRPLAFVGKGVCFDAGGISIKPADGMEYMKSDMAGAAAVVGLMQVLAMRKAKINAVGILGLVENMPDGAALRPGDILTSMSGQTIEVIDTDAEGRLVLADALWYCQDRFQPQLMIDLATLTGAIVTALGSDYAGLFSNNDALADKLLASSMASGEWLWRMPLPQTYEKQIDSQVADIKNSAGHQGSAIKAGLFLQRFVNGVPWAHLDIAPTAWRRPGASPSDGGGATGFGVRLLNQFVAEHFEQPPSPPGRIYRRSSKPSD